MVARGLDDFYARSEAGLIEQRRYEARLPQRQSRASRTNDQIFCRNSRH
jgi:hypothetical protein